MRAQQPDASPGKKMKEGQAADESIFAGLMNAVNWFDEAFQNSLEAAGYARTTRVESFVIVNILAIALWLGLAAFLARQYRRLTAEAEPAAA